MMKTKLIAATALLSFSFLCKSSAQEEPMPYVYSADFENVTKDNYDKETVTINGKRWLFVNARITSDPLRWIPQGKKAVELRASENMEDPTRIELLDPVKGAQIAYDLIQSGQDGHFGRKGWKLEISYDNGKTWGGKDMIFDIVPSATSEIVPDSQKEFVFRFIFTGDPHLLGSGQRILVDNICVTDPEDSHVPTQLVPGYLTNGYRTSSTTVSFKPIIRGTWWILDDPQFDEPIGNAYIQVQMDNQTPVIVSSVNESTIITFDNLSVGKHVITMQLMNLKTKKPFTSLDVKTVTDIFVDPYTSIKGLGALRDATPGKFYEVTSAVDKTGKELPVFANYMLHERAQKWLYDTRDGILLDDPFRYNYIKETIPEKAVIIKKMRGQLVEMDNNLMFRLDSPLEFAENVTQEYNFQNGILDNLKELNDNSKKYAGSPVVLSCMRFKSLTDNPEDEIAVRPNGRYEIVDKTGDKIVLQNLYSYKLIQNKCSMLLPGEIDIFGLVGFSFPENKVTVFPLFFEQHKDTSVESVLSSDLCLRISFASAGLRISADRSVDVTIYDIAGRIVARANADGGRVVIPFHAPAGTYLAKAVAGKVVQTVKFNTY